jgi:hypothetical protein
VADEEEVGSKMFSLAYDPLMRIGFTLAHRDSFAPPPPPPASPFVDLPRSSVASFASTPSDEHMRCCASSSSTLSARLRVLTTLSEFMSGRETGIGGDDEAGSDARDDDVVVVDGVWEDEGEGEGCGGLLKGLSLLLLCCFCWARRACFASHSCLSSTSFSSTTHRGSIQSCSNSLCVRTTHPPPIKANKFSYTSTIDRGPARDR